MENLDSYVPPLIAQFWSSGKEICPQQKATAKSKKHSSEAREELKEMINSLDID